MELSLFFLWNPLVFLSDGILKERRAHSISKPFFRQPWKGFIFHAEEMSFTLVTLQWNHLWHLVKLRCHASREESCFCSSYSIFFVITTLVASKCIFQVSDEMKWSNSKMGHFSSWKTGPNNAINTFSSFVYKWLIKLVFGSLSSIGLNFVHEFLWVIIYSSVIERTLPKHEMLWVFE